MTSPTKIYVLEGTHFAIPGRVRFLDVYDKMINWDSKEGGE